MKTNWRETVTKQGPRIALIVLAATLALAACAAPAAQPAAQPAAAQQPAQVTKIDVEQLATMLENKDFAFVNVHIPYEGEIAGTDANIPFDEIASHLDELPAKDAKIVLYCRSGNMSDQASQELVKLGYTDVYDVEGGMKAWTASGRSLETSGQ